MSKGERVVDRTLRVKWQPPACERKKLGGFAKWAEVEKWPASSYPKFYAEPEWRALQGFVNHTEGGQQPSEDEMKVASALVRYLLTMPGRPRMHTGGNKRNIDSEFKKQVRATIYVEDFEAQGMTRTQAVTSAARKMGNYSPRKVWDALKHMGKVQE